MALDQPMTEVTLPAVEPLDVQGLIVMAGSSTLEPLAQRIYQNFVLDGYADQIEINSVGTGAGFHLFCAEQSVDIVIASRQITLDELAACTEQGVTPVAFPIATDALSIIVSSQNTFVENVTAAELAAIFGAERWSDVNPDWPNEPIERFIPPATSGTFDFFVEQVLGGDATGLLNAPNVTQNQDFASLAQDVANDPYAIGFIGYVYYRPYGQQEALAALAIEGSPPSAQSVLADAYPLKRPLFFYASLETLLARPQVLAFANFFLTHVADEIEETGYFPIAPEVLNRSKARLQEVIQGTIVVAGSPTLGPVTQAIANRLSGVGYEGGVRIQSTRADDEFRIFCQDWRSDLASSTRRMDIAEIISCTVSDRIPLGFRVGTEALAVVVHPDNAFAHSITRAELADLFRVERWSQVNPAWPDEPIQRFIPAVTSGSFSLFVEKVFDGDIEPLLLSANTLQIADSETLAGGAANTLNGIAFLPYSVYLRHADRLQLLTIDQITPNGESIEQGRYLLTRPLFVFSATSIIQQKPQVAALLNLLLAHLDEESQRLDYFPASPRVMAENRTRLLEAMRTRE